MHYYNCLWYLQNGVAGKSNPLAMMGSILSPNRTASTISMTRLIASTSAVFPFFLWLIHMTGCPIISVVDIKNSTLGKPPVSCSRALISEIKTWRRTTTTRSLLWTLVHRKSQRLGWEPSIFKPHSQSWLL